MEEARQQLLLKLSQQRQQHLEAAASSSSRQVGVGFLRLMSCMHSWYSLDCCEDEVSVLQGPWLQRIKWLCWTGKYPSGAWSNTGPCHMTLTTDSDNLVPYNINCHLHSSKGMFCVVWCDSFDVVVWSPGRPHLDGPGQCVIRGT